MLKSKKGCIMRHPYLTITVLGLAATGAISISPRVKGFLKEKSCCVTNMVKGMKSND